MVIWRLEMADFPVLEKLSIIADQTIFDSLADTGRIP